MKRNLKKKTRKERVYMNMEGEGLMKEKNCHKRSININSLSFQFTISVYLKLYFYFFKS